MKKVFSLIVGIMISMSILIFSACTPTYDNVSLVPSATEISLAVGEEKTFDIQIKNYSSEMSNQLSINNTDNVISVESIEVNGSHTFVTIKGLRVGQTVLNVKSFEGNKECEVVVEVYQTATQIIASETAYVLKTDGNFVDLKTAGFVEVAPVGASNQNLIFTYLYIGGEVTVTAIKVEASKVYLITDDQQEIEIIGQNFSLTAKLLATDVSPKTFDIKILSPIQTGDLKYIKKGLTAEYLAQSEVVDGQISLISNLSTNCYYEFELECESDVEIKAYAQNNIASKINVSEDDYVKTTIFSKFISLQADQVGQDVLTIELSYKDFPTYKKILTYGILTSGVPTSIVVNGKSMFAEPITLFENFSGYSGVYSILPTIYKTDSSFDSVEFKVLSKVGEDFQPLENWAEYIDVRYKNIPMTQDFQIPSSDFADNVLRNNIYVYGKSRIDEFYVSLEVKSDLLQDNKVDILIPFNIKLGVADIRIQSDYANGLYVDIAGGTQDAEVVVYNELSAYTDGLQVAYLGDAERYFTASASVKTLGKVTISITPKALGEGTITVIMPNGAMTAVKIFVEKTINPDRVLLEMGDNANNANITEVTYKNGNVSTIAMRYVGNDKPENLVTALSLNTNGSNLYSVHFSVQQAKNVIKTNSQNLSFEVVTTGEAVLTLNVSLFKIENFKKVSIAGAKNFVVGIKIYSPITEIFFVQNEEKINKVSIYRESDVGYEYAKLGLAKTSFEVKALRHDGTIEGISDLNYSQRNEYSTQIDGTISGFGKSSLANSICTLNCNDNFALADSDFWMQFSVTEYGVTIANIITVNIEKYKPLYSVGFYNYVSDLYLSASNSSYSFQTFMDPEADCQEFDVVFTINGEENRDYFDIEVASDFSSVKITHKQNIGGCQGVLYFIPLSAYYLDNDRIKFAYYQTINVSYGDGSEANPEPISTTKQFANALKNYPNKHYIITTNLDFSEIQKYDYQFGTYTLTGSIKGANTSIRFLNINITSVVHDGTQNAYAGLFKNISGSISNITFEGSIKANSTNDYANYIGLIAGKNLGKLNNVAVLLAGSEISIKATDPLKTLTTITVGGFVGVNEGIIQTNIDSEKITTLATMLRHIGAQKVLYDGYSTNTSYGGIAGQNKGVIARITQNQEIVLFNDNINSAMVNIQTKGLNNVGAIAGINDYAVLQGDYSTSKVMGHIITGSILAEQYSPVKDITLGGECVGGVAGNNYSYIDNCIVRANISGFDLVGGIAGNDAKAKNDNNAVYITNSKVQAIKTTDFAPMITAISNLGNIGAISGNETSEINQNCYSQTNQAMYYYTIDPDARIYPVVYDAGASGAFNSIKYDANDPYYNLFSASEAVIKIKDIANSAYKLETSEEYQNKVVMMEYYEAENSAQQEFIAHLNKNLQVPFVFENPDSISITSLTPSVLVVDAFGKIELRSIGLATLVVSSLLDTSKVDYVYIYVTNAFDSFALGNSVKEPIITSEWNIYAGKPLTLQYFFTHTDITTVDKHNQTVQVALKTSDAPTIKYNNEANAFIKINISGNIITFTALDLTGQTNTGIISISPQFKLNLEGIGEVTLDDSALQGIVTEGLYTLDLLMSAKKGTSAITSNIAETTVQPIDEINVNITQTTDFEDDYLKIYSYKDTPYEDQNDDYFIITDFSGYVFEDGVYKINYDGNQTNVGNFTFQFNFEKYITSDYAGTYGIIFEADNGKSFEIQVTLQTQTVESLNIKNYYDVTTQYDMTKLQSDYMASGALNLMVIEFYPHFADFDYVYIKNGADNLANQNFVLFETYSLSSGNKLEYLKGAGSTVDGIQISKTMVENLALNSSLSKLYVLYSTTSKTTVDSQAVIEIEVVKEQNSVPQIVYETQKTLTIIIKDNVTFTIDGRNQNAGNNYVAKGVTYDLNLSIYGFDQSEMVVEATYANYKSTLNPFDNTIDTSLPLDIVYMDGDYKLVISSNVAYQNNTEGYVVQIATFGRSMANNLVYESGKSYLNLVIVDFVVLTDNIRSFTQGGAENIDEFEANTIIKNSNNAVVNLSIGDKYELGAKLQSGITVEYDQTNANVVSELQNFEKSLTNNGTWKIKADTLGIVGKYLKELTLDHTTNITNDYFKITGLQTGGDIKISYIPLKLTNYQNPAYYFSYEGKFVYKNGLPMFEAQSEYAFDLSTDFVIDVYPNSTEDNAIPVTTYEELLAMENDAHYILLNDITLPSDFTPLQTQVASLDGNGYSIILPSTLTFENGGELGVFSIVQENTVLKNITLTITAQTKITLNSAEEINFGLLAGENFGIITNCQISCSDYVQVVVSMPNQVDDTKTNYVAGLVAHNVGSITNSRVKLNISAIANMAGFVAVNEGKIASSYVKNSFISNSGSAHYHATAGFVLKNGLSANSSAQIISSYVVGEVNTQNIYSTSRLYYINSNPVASGFVYQNHSKISDCYSDIYINASSTRAGFAIENAGQISNAYSTCTFNENTGRNTHAFIFNNYAGDNQNRNYGQISSCYYLNIADNADIDGLKGLTAQQFGQASTFSNFIFSSNIDKTEAIWFYPASANEQFFTIDGIAQSFTVGKPNIVSANIITSSQKAQDANLTTIDEVTGETIYVYYETLSQSGTTYNPILLHSAENFETNLIQNATSGVNNKVYRLVGDINFAETQTITALSKLIYTGTLEGNGMTINGFTINNISTSQNGGLFAQIGQGYSNNGVVKNLTLAPKYLNFPNTQNVGTLAGLLEGGKVYNLTCDGFKNNASTGVAIYGFNNVGGVIGVATNDFQIVGVTSSVSAKSTYDHTKTSKPLGEFTSATASNNCSYAGTIVGVAYGSGKISNISANGKSRASGEIAGLLVGKLGKNTSLSNVVQEVNANQYINASAYGGIIVGECAGNISDIKVFGELKQDFFSIVDTQNLPVAVGGIVGLQTGGNILNIDAEYSLQWSQISPPVVGGVVGEMLGGTLSDINFSGDIILKAETNLGAISKVIVGGVVGQLLAQQSVETTIKNNASVATLKNITTSGKIQTETVNILKVIAGGVIGKVANTHQTSDQSTTTKFKHSFNNVQNNIDLSLDAIIYNGILNTYFGGLVGAVFSDIQENYAGELLIRDKDTEIAVGPLLQSTSNSKMTIDIQDYKGNASANIYYGGILGQGYSVSNYISLSGVPNDFTPWGVMLGSATKNLTNPSYSGQYYEENGGVFEYETMKDSEFLSITANTQAQEFENN